MLNHRLKFKILFLVLNLFSMHFLQLQHLCTKLWLKVYFFYCFFSKILNCFWFWKLLKYLLFIITIRSLYREWKIHRCFFFFFFTSSAKYLCIYFETYVVRHLMVLIKCLQERNTKKQNYYIYIYCILDFKYHHFGWTKILLFFLFSHFFGNTP